MPFTFSHAAIVAPFLALPKRWYSVTGLVIGSMGPDLEYYLRMRIQSDYSHTLGGIFWFDLPVCILVAFLFHNIIRNSLIDNLPVFLKARFIRFCSFNWNKHFKYNWFIILISFLIGIASHILWDSFTHPGSYFTERFICLTDTVSIIGVALPVMKVIQHTSTLLGISIVLWMILRLPKSEERTSGIHPKYWFIVICCTILVSGIRIVCGLNYYQTGHLVVTLFAAFFLSLCITGYFWQSRMNG